MLNIPESLVSDLASLDLGIRYMYTVRILIWLDDSESCLEKSLY